MTPVPPGAEDDRAVQANALVDKKVLPHDGLIPEDLTKQLCALYDIPEPRMMLATSEDDLAYILKEVGTPVVLKISSPDIVHKTNEEGVQNYVQKNVKNAVDAKKAYNEILETAEKHSPAAGIRGVIVQKEILHDREFVLHAIREGEKFVLSGDTEEASLSALIANVTALMADVPAMKELHLDPIVKDGESLQVLDAKIIIERGRFIDAD